MIPLSQKYKFLQLQQQENVLKYAVKWQSKLDAASKKKLRYKPILKNYDISM